MRISISATAEAAFAGVCFRSLRCIHTLEFVFAHVESCRRADYIGRKIVDHVALMFMQVKELQWWFSRPELHCRVLATGV